jgi:hypothetical protein
VIGLVFIWAATSYVILLACKDGDDV